jgi:FkbM family methyltransferase
VRLIKPIFWRVRRYILKTFVPELIWPSEVIIDGAKIKIRGTPYSFGTKRALVLGRYEDSERKLLKGKVQSGDHVIEMGGSIGILSAILSEMIGPNGLLVSIEASARLSDFSRTWLEKRQNIKIVTGFGFPVYSINQSISIESFDESAGALGGKLSFDVATGTKNENENLYDIKKIISDFQLQPTVLVIDVEGTERILESIAPKFPDSVRVILIELHPHMYAHESQQRIIDVIINDGFVLESVDTTVYLFRRSKN